MAPPWIVPILLLNLAIKADDGPEPIVVRVEATDPPPYFVGQAIGLRVVARAGADRPEIKAPNIAGATLDETGRGVRQLSVAGIGDLVVTESNDFEVRFRLVPSKAGPLLIPPFAARLEAEGRSGKSRQATLTVRDLPTAGRTRAFLGGVGGVEAIEAEAEPRSLAAGRSFEYRLRVVGSAARGSGQRPDLAAFDRPPLGLTVEPLPAEATADPPSRTFRYRIRATRAGEATLPAVAVSWFDPKAQAYLTKLSPRVPVRVVEVAAFDPAELVDEPPPEPAPSRWPFIAAALAGLGGVAGAVVLGRRLLRGRRDDPARFARRAALALGPTDDPAALAGRIEAALADYLRIAGRRAGGTLTPAEAASALADPDAPDDLGPAARDLIAACDRARYSGRSAPAADLAADARHLFEALGKRRPGNDPGRRPGPPG